jgi:hypothetical protein
LSFLQNQIAYLLKLSQGPVEENEGEHWSRDLKYNIFDTL